MIKYNVTSLPCISRKIVSQSENVSCMHMNFLVQVKNRVTAVRNGRVNFLLLNIFVLFTKFRLLFG